MLSRGTRSWHDVSLRFLLPTKSILRRALKVVAVCTLGKCQGQSKTSGIHRLIARSAEGSRYPHCPTRAQWEAPLRLQYQSQLGGTSVTSGRTARRTRRCDGHLLLGLVSTSLWHFLNLRKRRSALVDQGKRSGQKTGTNSIDYVHSLDDAAKDLQRIRERQC